MSARLPIIFIAGKRVHLNVPAIVVPANGAA